MNRQKNKTKEQLLRELETARQEIAGLKKKESGRNDVEKALADSKQRFRNIVHSSPMGIHMYVLESGNRLVFQGANPAADKILGIDNSRFIGKTIEEAFPPLADTEIPEQYRRAALLGESWQTQQINYEDQQISGAYEVYAFQTRPGAMAAIFLDITERKKTEMELKANEEKYRQLVQLSNDAIYLLYNRKFELINEKFKQMFNVTLEYVNSPGFDFMQLVSPKSRELIRERNSKLDRGEKLNPYYSFTAISMDNREIEVEASLTYIEYKDGIAVQGILRDVTERKQIEEKLRQAQKLESIGTLAGGIAHDFNNILMGIQGRTSLMLMKPDLPPFLKEHLLGIEEYVNSATELTRQLLGFARGGKYEVKPVDIVELIRKSATLFGRTKKEIKIHEKFAEDTWTVEVDAGQIEQVFLNLFVNAWQAMPGGGDLSLQTENRNLDASITQPYQLQPGPYVKISITDTGVGMDQSTRERIFDPFFTTKKLGRGTGLGLATVYGIMKNHDGFINVYSEKGRGSTFSIYLPASKKAPILDKPVPESTLEGTGTILIVDDEEIIIEVSVPMLESLGYHVWSAGSGREALEIYRDKGEQIDLVIMDMIMPDIGGGDAFDRLKEMNPQVKVLLSSGYSLNGQAKKILDRGCRGFIQKPFDLTQLSRKVKEVLAG